MNWEIFWIVIITIEVIISIFLLLKRDYSSQNKHTEHYKKIRDKTTKIEKEVELEEIDENLEDNGSEFKALSSYLLMSILFLITLGVSILSLKGFKDTGLVDNHILFDHVTNGLGFFAIFVGIILLAVLGKLICIILKRNDYEDECNSHTNHYKKVRDKTTKKLYIKRKGEK
jgi:hypothetical protein